MTDDESTQSDEEQTQYGGTEDQEPTTVIGDEDERAETDNEGADN
ncbi:hypothetical protein RBH26_11935 [Natronolimnohabitans sp. A-GB9]|nr:hypothetical protein [Natronolimnohabitans sp. A-GB9]MDQ2051191.1 hypothetical protein [Natronolimnohabitans sp. A-GB9]